MINLNGTILTRRICDKIKQISEERGGTTIKMGCADIGANPPVPAGFQAATASCRRRALHDASGDLSDEPHRTVSPSCWIATPLEKQD